MRSVFHGSAVFVLGLGCTLFAMGCGKSPTATSTASATNSATTPAAPKREFRPVALTGETAAVAPVAKLTEEESLQAVRAALNPLQIMIGPWRAINSKTKSYAELEWVWDFRTQPSQPALVLTSDKDRYLRQARLTYIPATKKFQLTAETPDGPERKFEGQFIDEPLNLEGDDGKPQRTYKLELTQVTPVGGEQWRLQFKQVENNRYQLEVARQRASGEFAVLDSVGTQRMGTSFAVNDEDYGEKKCIISGGLGSSTVSYEGKTYWVCCSGCKAAFEEDPKRWISRLSARP